MLPSISDYWLYHQRFFEVVATVTPLSALLPGNSLLHHSVVAVGVAVGVGGVVLGGVVEIAAAAVVVLVIAVIAVTWRGEGMK